MKFDQWLADEMDKIAFDDDYLKSIEKQLNHLDSERFYLAMKDTWDSRDYKQNDEWRQKEKELLAEAQKYLDERG